MRTYFLVAVDGPTDLSNNINVARATLMQEDLNKAMWRSPEVYYMDTLSEFSDSIIKDQHKHG